MSLISISSYFTRFQQFHKSVFNARNETSSEECSMDMYSIMEDGVKRMENEWTIEVLKNKIREQLLQPINEMKKSDSLLTSMKNTDIRDLKQFEQSEINPAFLWSSFIGKLEFMQYFEEFGADISYSSEKENFNALHLAALAGCVKCCGWLLAKGCPITVTARGLTPLHYAVLGNSKEVVEFLIQNGCQLSNTLINSAVYANARDCVRLLLSMKVDVNAYQDGMTPLHVATDLRYTECMKELLNHPCIDIDLKTETRRYTALHLAAENGYTDCIDLLLDKKTNIGEINDKMQTALHLACKNKHLECVEVLVKRDSPVNELDLDQKTPLHAAIAESSSCLPILELLIHWKADVNIPDRYGFTPLHTAALNELEDCVTFLILKGANIAAETNSGMTALNIISRKTIGSIPAITERLTKSLAFNTEQSLKFNFRELISNSRIGEINFLYTFYKEGHKEILEHPLCRAFLHMKWEKIKPYYLFRVFMVLLAVCLLTLIVTVNSANECHDIFGRNGTTEMNNRSRSEHNSINKNILWYLIVDLARVFTIFLTILNIIRKLLCAVSYTSLKNYLVYPINIVEFFLTIFIFLLCLSDSNDYTYNWRKFIGVFSVLLGWIYLTFTIGQLPFFGTYITMYKKVLIELLKLLTAYFCLLIGFTFTFSVLFPTDKFFQNPFTAFVRTLVMMTGELDFTDITEDNESSYVWFAAFFVLALFIILVTIVLMNLLIGIAVSDVEGLRKTADLKKLVQQTQLIYFLELSVFHGYIPKSISKFFKRFLFVSPNAYKVVVYVRPLNPMEKRLPRKVMKTALQLALDKKKIQSKKSNEEKIQIKLELLENKINEIYNLVFKLSTNPILHDCDNKIP